MPVQLAHPVAQPGIGPLHCTPTPHPTHHTSHACGPVPNAPCLTSTAPPSPSRPAPQGGYRACNRIGIEACTSPFLKISFETAASFLVSATLHGDVDSLTSPAARIVLGRPVGVGTGCLDLVQNMGAAAQAAQVAC